MTSEIRFQNGSRITFLPPSLYDQAEREGWDMRGYARQLPIPDVFVLPLLPNVMPRRFNPAQRKVGRR